MYIRWQSRRRQQSQFGKWTETDTGWSAIIVENTRVGGKPVQRHIAYLVGFTESAIKIAPQRCYLWDGITARLDQLGNQITPADRAKIEAAIAKKIPRPTAAEYKDAARDAAQSIGWDWISQGFKDALHDEAAQWQDRKGDSDSVTKIQSALNPQPQVVCSFCGKGDDAVSVMVQGHAGAICNECADHTTKIIADRMTK